MSRGDDPNEMVTKIDRDVIVDLLPLVMAGEASPATRALVDAWLARDPELARRVQQGGAELPGLAGAPRPELELQALTRTRGLLGLQRWLFGLAIGFIAIALALRITFREGALPEVRLLLFDYPLELGIFLALGVACGIAYRAVRRRTSL